MTLADYRTALDARSCLRAWELQETSGTTLADRQGVQNATASGTPVLGVAGPVSGVTGIDWNAAGSATVPDHTATRFGGTTAHSLVFWIKLKSVPAAGVYKRILSKEGASNAGWLVFLNPGTSQIQWRRGATYYASDGSLNLTLNQWAMVTLVFTGTRAQAWLNKTLVMDWASTTSVTAATGVLTLGQAYYGGEIPDAAMSLVSLHSVALAQSDVTALYDALQATGAPADTTPPVVSDAQINAVTHNTAVITARTDEAAQLVVEYGPTTSYGSTATSTAGGTTHAATLTLSPGSVTKWRARAVDTAGNPSAWVVGADITAEQSLQALIDAATAGTTLNLPASSYRQEATIAKALTLQGGADTPLLGSDIWRGWVQEVTTWLSILTVPALPWTDNAAVDLIGAPQAGWPEQVFVDGAELVQLAAGSMPGPGQFALVAAGDRRIRLGSDPTGKTVEVTTRTEVLKVTAATVTIRGRANTDRIVLKHAGSNYQHGVLCANHGGTPDNLTIEHADVAYGHNTGIQTVKAGNLTIRKVRAHHNGMNGGNIQGHWRTAIYWGALVEDCLFDWNNTQLGKGGHHAAGLKISYFGGKLGSPAIIRRSVFANNLASAGLWLDSKVPGWLIGSESSWADGNWAYRNGAHGFRVEINNGQDEGSDLFILAKNSSYQNQDAGLWLDVVKNVHVRGHRSVYDKRNNAQFTHSVEAHWGDSTQGRTDMDLVGGDAAGPVNVKLDDLFVVNEQGAQRKLVAWRQDGAAGTLGHASNTGQNGVFAVTDAAGNVTNESGGYKPFSIAYTDKSLAEFGATQYGAGATLVASTAAKNTLLGSYGLPLTPTGDPAPPSATPIPVFAATYRRRRAA